MALRPMRSTRKSKTCIERKETMIDYGEKDRAALIASVPEQKVTHPSRAQTVCRARERFGKKFATDTNSDFKPSRVPVLSRWLAQQHLSKQSDVFAL